MATEKKTTAAKTAEKKETAAKTTAKKTAAKAEPAKKTETAKKPAAKKTTKKAEAKVEMFIEFAGVQVSVDEIVANVKKANGKDAKNITVYVKPEESKAYYVADGEEKEMDVYFV